MGGLWKLSWVEAKVFAREPLGLVGTLVIPAVLFLILGGTFAGARSAPGVGEGVAVDGAPFNVAILVALLAAVSAVMSLVTIVSIYRESGILKRLRSTPLSPVTILGAQVVVQLAFTALSLGLLFFVGRRVAPAALDVHVPSFTGALLLGTLSLLALGFVIASVVPTARFARPISAIVLYPMVAFSGLFFPLDLLSPPVRIVAYSLPTTHAVALMQGVWEGGGWHWWSAGALLLSFALCLVVSNHVFRWE